VPHAGPRTATSSARERSRSFRIALLSFSLTVEALGYLIDQGFNPDFGARPLKRAIERLVEDPLSEGLLRGEFKEAKHIHISLKDKHLLFEPVEEKKEVGAGEPKKG